MVEARTFFTDESDIRAYVCECENAFESSLLDAAERIVRSKTRIITLSGPSCSGKTTLAKKTVAKLADMGKKVHVFSIDDFYFDRDFLIKKAEKEKKPIDFDSIETIDLARFRETVEEISDSDTVYVPTFDFKSGVRVKDRVYEIDDDDIFLFEGIHAIYPEVVALLENRYLSIFVSVAESLKVGEVIFDKNDIRLFRRIVRDYNFRGATPEFTLGLWRGVRQNEESNIFPYIGRCDIKINSLLPYEISMIKPYLRPLLQTIPADSEYYGKAQDIINKMKYIPEISREYMPCDSLYREFLG